MDITKQFRKRKLLKTNLGVYDLTLCRWKGLDSFTSRKKQICNLNTTGYIHSAAQLKSSIYTIVGPTENHTQLTMHSFNFKNSTWRQWPDCQLPSNRDSFGFISHLNELYMFGGSSQSQQFGDTHVYSTFSSTWRKLQSEGPSPRNPMVFTDVNGKFILQYGGIDIESGRLLEDAFLLLADAWRELRVINAPLHLTGAKAVTCGEGLYLFGGQTQLPEAQPIPNTSTYQLIINQQQLTLQFVELSLSTKLVPCARTSHSLIAVNNENLVLIGGVGLQGRNKGIILRDMWLFNTDELRWIRVDPANGILRGFSDSALCLSNNKIYVIGGLVEQLDTWNEQISIIEFGEDEVIKNEICSNCQQRVLAREKEDKAFPKTVVVTVGFFYNLSLEMRHPFQAIETLRQCAGYMGASTFRFDIAKGLSENEYIEVNWDGRALLKSQFQQLINHSSSEDEEFSKFISMMKIASMRLGKTLLFINSDETYRRVFVFSADSKICPEFDEIYNYFAFLYNVESGLVESHEGRAQQKIIINLLSSRVSNPDELLNRESGSHLFIFEKNILVTSEKTYYYELIASAFEDITVFRSAKKLLFLEDLGYSLAAEPELSLKSYVSFATLATVQPLFYLGKSETPLQVSNYKSMLKCLEGHGVVSRVEMAEGAEGLEYEADLYKVQAQKLISDNYGVMVYYQGRLVNRLDSNFGDFFKEHFFKTKYKTAETIFEHLGVINIKGGLRLNYIGTWFQKKQNYYQFILNLRDAMCQTKQERYEGQCKVTGQEERKQLKFR